MWSMSTVALSGSGLGVTVLVWAVPPVTVKPEDCAEVWLTHWLPSTTTAGPLRLMPLTKPVAGGLVDGCRRRGRRRGR